MSSFTHLTSSITIYDSDDGEEKIPPIYLVLDSHSQA